jgi:mannose-6-phosphate isomerase-like protein (cupin superfamily)
MYASDEIYVVLEGRGMLDVEGEDLELQEGRAAFVPAGVEHCFSGYEHLTVLAIRGPGSQGRSRRRRLTGIAS